MNACALSLGSTKICTAEVVVAGCSSPASVTPRRRLDRRASSCTPSRGRDEEERKEETPQHRSKVTMACGRRSGDRRRTDRGDSRRRHGVRHVRRATTGDGALLGVQAHATRRRERRSRAQLVREAEALARLDGHGAPRLLHRGRTRSACSCRWSSCVGGASNVVGRCTRGVRSARGRSRARRRPWRRFTRQRDRRRDQDVARRLLQRHTALADVQRHARVHGTRARARRGHRRARGRLLDGRVDRLGRDGRRPARRSGTFRRARSSFSPAKSRCPMRSSRLRRRHGASASRSIRTCAHATRPLC